MSKASEFADKLSEIKEQGLYVDPKIVDIIRPRFNNFYVTDDGRLCIHADEKGYITHLKPTDAIMFSVWIVNVFTEE